MFNHVCVGDLCFFFFKQKTAYEMRISDWSSDVCSSDLVVIEQLDNFDVVLFAYTWPAGCDETVVKRDLVAFWRYFMPDFAIGDAFGLGMLTVLNDELFQQLGRASCRERVCQSV